MNATIQARFENGRKHWHSSVVNLACACMSVLLASFALVTFIVAGPVAASTAETDASSPSVHTWGQNISESPEAVTGLPADITSIQSANWGGLAIANGDVWQWNASSSPSATEVAGPTGAVSVGEGFDFGAAVTSNGSLWTWGDQSSQGDLCLGDTEQTEVTPTRVPGVHNAKAASGGADHLLILLKNGTVEACGSNLYGQLGDGTTTNSSTPVRVKGLTNVVAISSGANFSAALEASGQVYEWGENSYGELGDGTTTNSDLPVMSLANVRQIFAGGSGQANGQIVALADDGTAYAWGNNHDGQLGTGEAAPEYCPTPLHVATPKGVTFSYIATAGSSSYALDTSGNVWGWGNDAHGQIGNGERTRQILKPIKVASGFSNLSAVAGVVVVD